MINGRNFFDQSVKNDIRPYGSIRKNAAGEEMTLRLVGYLIIHT